MKLTIILGENNDVMVGFAQKLIKNAEPENNTIYFPYPEIEPGLDRSANGRHSNIKTDNFIQQIINNQNDGILITNSEIVFDRIRVNIKRKNISYEDVSIIYFNLHNEPEYLKIDKDGRLPYWPNWMFSAYEENLNILLL